jgi:uncharacterized protein YndB with AHSA1/START domain
MGGAAAAFFRRSVRRIGDVLYLAGEFREVDPPTPLAYTFRWEDSDPDDEETVVTLSIRDLG